MKIAVDFDSVLSDTMIAWVQKYNEKYGTRLTKQDICSWRFWDDLKISKDIALAVFEEAWTDWSMLPPTEPDQATKIDKLKKFGSVDIVTEINENYIVNIKKWLIDKGIQYENIVHGKGKKAALDYNIFIDDNPEFAIESSTKNKNCLLYDQPWNRNIQPHNKIIRINSLTGAFNVIKEKLDYFK